MKETQEEDLTDQQRYKKLFNEVIVGALQDYSAFTIHSFYAANPDSDIEAIIEASFINLIQFLKLRNIRLNVKPNEMWSELFSDADD